MEATRGNGYAPVWGSLVMTTMMIVTSSLRAFIDLYWQQDRFIGV